MKGLIDDTMTPTEIAETLMSALREELRDWANRKDDMHPEHISRPDQSIIDAVRVVQAACEKVYQRV